MLAYTDLTIGFLEWRHDTYDEYISRPDYVRKRERAQVSLLLIYYGRLKGRSPFLSTSHESLCDLVSMIQHLMAITGIQKCAARRMEVVLDQRDELYRGEGGIHDEALHFRI